MAESESTKFEAIVLAAGAGIRFGGGKLTAPFRGQPLIAAALASARAAPVASVVVAVGDDPEVERVVLALNSAKLNSPTKIRIVRVPHPAQGMGASLAAAAGALSADLDGVLVFLGDMPLIGAQVAPALMAALSGPEAIVAPVHDGRRGHPVLFGGDWIPALRALDGDIGAQALIRQAGARFTLVQTDDAGVLFDVDHPGDLTPSP